MSCRRCGSDNKLAEADLCPNCVEAAEFREQLTIVKAERDEFKAAYEELDAVLARLALAFENAMVRESTRRSRLPSSAGGLPVVLSSGSLRAPN